MEEGLTIRTMKDDVAEFRNQEHGQAQKPVTIRPVPAHHSTIRRAFVFIVSILIISSIGIGGWYGYTQLGAGHMVPVLSSGNLSIQDIIPKDATAIVEYNTANDQNRAVIQSLWNNSSSGDANPATILTSGAISRVYYFSLPGDSSPFLAIKKDDNSKNIISQLSSDQVGDQGGWYIAHSTSLDRYVADLANGSIQGNSNAAMLGQDGYAARFIVQSNSLDSIFGLPVRLPSNRQQIVFDINEASQDGALHAEYAISQHAVPEQLHPDVTDIQALVPGDATFLRIGESFSNDVTTWQQRYGILDSAQYASPAIQQFIAQLTAPYGFYTRTGADGVPDVGLIIALPDSLKKKLSYSEPVIDQMLTLFAPLITGRPLTDQIVFANTEYASVPIRYANLAGKTASLDYTVGDNFILIASSKEGMSVLADRALNQGNSMSSQSPWSSLINKDTLSAPYNMIMGFVKDTGLSSLLPRAGAGQTSSASVLVSTKGDNTGIKTQATVLFAQ